MQLSHRVGHGIGATAELRLAVALRNHVQERELRLVFLDQRDGGTLC